MNKSQVYNFSAGPAMLPKAVLLRAQAELLDWQGTGTSVMEVSHRGAAFENLAQTITANLRTLLHVPADYEVLFLAGGATVQFAMIPLNLLRGKSSADYLVTGHWSNKASELARSYCNVNVVANAKVSNFTDIPSVDTWQCDPNAAYFHYADNETIGGMEFNFIPAVGDVPLIVDASSNILSRPIDVSRYGMIYAGAQKNIGIAGLTVVVVRRDLMGKALSHTPTVFNYALQSELRSMANTPPTFAWYMTGLVLEWLMEQGGVEAIAKVNQRKAEKLYTAIDASPFYCNVVQSTCRSRMNIPFTLARPELDAAFLKNAAEVGLVGLKGHAAVGGMRASLYNSMPEAGVDALIAFMQAFQ
ncbi:MAG: 3-phosphoserine/phosphohydroxythreonine transaminase, partial [Pseudomonadota bacterium]